MTTALDRPTTTPAKAARVIATQSVLMLNAGHALASRAILDPQIMHRIVMSGHYGWVEPGEADPRAKMGILSTWQLDLTANRLIIIVQSRVQPDWSALPSTALADSVVTIPIDLTIRTGDQYTFRTTINPVRNRVNPTDGQQIIKRRADTTPAHARDWFAHHLQPAGQPCEGPDRVPRIGATGDPSTMNVRILPRLRFNDRHKGKHLGRAEITGSLTVTEPTTFARTLSTGLGRARAYSCGLLLIRPVATE